MKPSHNVISKLQKLFIFILLLCLFQCAKQEKTKLPIMDSKDWIKLLSNPVGYLAFLSHRELRESPRCGGDQIGTLLGYNNNLEQPQKLGENQEIIDSTAPENEKFWSYFSPHKTTISIKLLNFIDNQQN